MSAIPLFETKGKRQNYQVTVEVAPIVPASLIDIPESDWEVSPSLRYVRCSTIVAAHSIRVMHRPTGLSCTLNDRRSGNAIPLGTAISIIKTRLLGKMLNDSINSDRAIVRHYDDSLEAKFQDNLPDLI